MATFARWTTDAEGDVTRTWCWQPCDAANVWLPAGPLSADELAEAIERIGEDDRSAGRELSDLVDEGTLEWTGENWSTRQDGIPGIEVDDDATDAEILHSNPATANVSAGGDARLVLFSGEWIGEEYEAVISSASACRFQPASIVRIVK